MKVKIEYVPNDPSGEKYHVFTKDNFDLFWKSTYRYKTLKEAEEYAKSRDQNVNYLGIYENGQRKGMAAWEDEEMEKKHPEEIDNSYLDETVEWASRSPNTASRKVRLPKPGD
jgi:hypothetical protein